MKRLLSTVQKQIPYLFCACGLFLLGSDVTVVDAKIVFCVADDIYVMNDDGSGLCRLTHNTQSKDRCPRWSPDGNRIAFVRYMDKERMQTSSELFIMNADGTNQKRLTHNTVFDGYPSWSPDGQYLAFDSGRDGGEVTVMELASTTTKRLTGAEWELGATAPDWSPDGTEIVYEKFLSNRAGLAHKNIYLMKANGEQQRPLFPDPKEGVPTVIMRFHPRWSADGQSIVFSDCKFRGEEHKCHLTVQRIGGRKQVITVIDEIFDANWLTSSACWMENDRTILFGLKLMNQPNSNYNLYRYVLQTRSLRRLTQDARDEREPDWIEGSLSVSPYGKLPTQWGDIKQAPSQESIHQLEN